MISRTVFGGIHVDGVVVFDKFLKFGDLWKAEKLDGMLGDRFRGTLKKVNVDPSSSQS